MNRRAVFPLFLILILLFFSDGTFAKADTDAKPETKPTPSK